jgi:hypothetical protein
MGDEGLELTPIPAGQTNELHSRLPQNDAQRAANDPALAEIITAWPSLTEPIKRAILALVG